MQKTLMIPPKKPNKVVRTNTVLKTCQKFIKVAGEKINNNKKIKCFPMNNMKRKLRKQFHL